MIRGNRASLSIYNDVRTVVEISAMLGIDAAASGDIGQPTPAGRAGRDLAPERLSYQRTYWSVTEEDDGDGADQTGFSALRRLVARLTPRARTLADLRRNGETVLWWSGGSDSSQGGFVWETDLIDKLSALGCDVYGTVYVEGNDESAG